jgi:hypothetical protein
VAEQLTNAAFGDTVAIPGTGSAWSIGWVPRTAKSTATNSIVAVYGTLP